MELNPDEYYLVARERSADALQDAEQWRLIKSLRREDKSPGRLEQMWLSLRRLMPAGRRPIEEPRRRRAVSSSTH